MSLISKTELYIIAMMEDTHSSLCRQRFIFQNLLYV